MSYEDGWAALNLEMPKRVPRTEYSAAGHHELVREVTGVDVDADSPRQLKREAAQAFMRAWHFDLVWSVGMGHNAFGEKRTKMGHAVYAAGGTDFDTDIHAMFSDPEDVLSFDPAEAIGRTDHAELVRYFETDYRDRCEQNPTCVNMTGIYVTLMSGLISLFGWDALLLAAGTDQKRFGEMANRYAAWCQQYFDAMADADVDTIMVHDDIVWTSGAFIHPDWYREYLFPNYKKYLTPLRDSGKKILFTSDGNYTEFIDDLAPLIDCFLMEPTTDMAYIAENYGRTHSFIGNADTRILLRGDRRQIRAEVERCMAIGKDCPGFFMCVGNHIPPNTPVDACLYYNEVYEELGKR